MLPTGTKYAKGDEVSSVCRERRIALGELSVHGPGPMNWVNWSKKLIILRRKKYIIFIDI